MVAIIPGKGKVRIEASNSMMCFGTAGCLHVNVNQRSARDEAEERCTDSQPLIAATDTVICLPAAIPVFVQIFTLQVSGGRKTPAPLPHRWQNH